MALGYPESVLTDMDESVIDSFCGVGNPLAIMEVEPGSDLLDIGCGAGCDLIMARKLLGAEGRVCGIDLTPAMLARARENCDAMGCDDIELALVESEKIPYADNSFAVVISNGVINLSPHKLKLFREIHRVLRPGGRLQFADIVLEKELPQDLAAGIDSWAQ